MKNLIYKSLMLFVLMSTLAISQPAEKAMERIQTLKKLKLLEILSLNEADTEKFLVKYSAAENAIKAKRDAFDDVEQELRQALKKGAPENDIKNLTQKMLNAQNDLINSEFDKIKSMQSVLNTKDYAKFVIFEKNFYKKLRKAVMDSPKRHRGNFGNDFEEE